MRSHPDPVDGGWAIDRDPATGACVYLIEDRCSIYAERPRACRKYDCRLHRLGKPFHVKWTLVNEVIKSWKSFEPKNRKEAFFLVVNILKLTHEARDVEVDHVRLGKLAQDVVMTLEAQGIPADDYHRRALDFAFALQTAMESRP